MMQNIVVVLLLLPALARAELLVVPIEEKDQEWSVAGLHLGDTLTSAKQILESNGYRCGQSGLKFSNRGYYQATATCYSLAQEGEEFPDPANTIEMRVAFPVRQNLNGTEIREVFSDHAPIHTVKYRSQFRVDGGKYYSAEQIENLLIDRYGQPLEGDRNNRWSFQNGDPIESKQLAEQAFNQKRRCERLPQSTTREIKAALDCERVRRIAEIGSAVKNVSEVRASLYSEQLLEIELRRNGYLDASEGVHALATIDARKAELGDNKGPTAADF